MASRADRPNVTARRQQASARPARRWAQTWLVGLGCALACCGEDADQKRASAIAQAGLFAEVASVGAFVDARGRRMCTATVVAENEVLTSARCAELAIQARMSFAASEGGSGLQRFRLAQAAGGRTLAADAGRPPAALKHAAGSVLRALAQTCRVDDVLALGLSHDERLCVMTRMTGHEIAAHQLMGLGNWRDSARVVLDQKSGLPPAGVFVDTPHAASVLWVVGTRSLREDAATVRRYAHRWREVAANVHEIHAVAESPVAWVDIGAALFVEVGPPGKVRLALVGTASRPYVAHGDASAGMIFTRVLATGAQR